MQFVFTYSSFLRTFYYVYFVHTFADECSPKWTRSFTFETYSLNIAYIWLIYHLLLHALVFGASIAMVGAIIKKRAWTLYYGQSN